MAAIGSAILCFATGYLFVALAIGEYHSQSDLLLRICLSLGLGQGLFSIVYFFARLSGFRALWWIDFAILALLLAAYLFSRARRRSVVLSHQVRQSSPRGLVTIAFAVALFAALYSATLRILAHPYGSGWDSFAIWNLHARFLYRGDAHWRDGFTALISWSHPDYPLLLPAAIAHFWTLLGHETPFVPALLGLVLTFATAGLLFSALDILVGRTSALLGGMALLATPFFIELGTWQYADVPLSFFFLATLVLLQIDGAQFRPGAVGGRLSRGFLALAGITGGLAAWTKNEGVLFLCALLLSRLFVRPDSQPLPSTKGSSRSPGLTPFLLTLLPTFCILLFFKRFIAPAGDLFSTPVSMLHKLQDPSRYWAVLKWFGKELFRFGHWMLIPIPLLMVGVFIMLKGKIPPKASPGVRASALAVALTLGGYFFIYLITPYDIYWHLRFSLNRLLIQLWPSAIFLYFRRIGSEPLDFPSITRDRVHSRTPQASEAVSNWKNNVFL
jgi:hypothetical protein